MTIETLELIHELLKRERAAKYDVYREAVDTHRAAVDDLSTKDEVIARLNDVRSKARDEYEDVNLALSEFESREW